MLYPNRSAKRPRVSSPFGPRKGGAFSFHYGADLIGFTRIHAIAAGKVTFAGWLNSAAGNTIVIDHGGGLSSLYMHNAAHAVSRGDRVTEGQYIAVMGQSGNASGDCNHLEIRQHGTSIEPLAYIAANLTRSGSSQTTTTHQEEDDMAINTMYYTTDPKYKYRVGITNDVSGLWVEYVTNDASINNKLAAQYKTNSAIKVTSSFFSALKNAARAVRPQTDIEVSVGQA